MDDTMKAIIGVGLVVGFVIIIILCVIADKKANKKFAKMIEEKYKYKDQAGKLGITENNQIMLEYGSGTLVGYKVWNLEDITYVGMSTIPATSMSFCFMDDNKKAMKGEYLTPSKKPVKERGVKSFGVRGSNTLDEIFEFVKKYKPDVMKIKNGKVEE